MTIPFIDLGRQYQNNKARIDKAIFSVLEHGQYIQGPEVNDLERKLAEYIGTKHALACSSGTDALLLPLMTKSLDKNDVVFTSPFTFFASAESISLAGATPVFVDIDPDTYNLCPKDLEKRVLQVLSEGKLSPKGIIPVDLFGIAADYNAIHTVARKYNLFVLEDAAQAFGANYHGKKACGLGNVAATSFYPAKPLGCYGDGGAVFTDDSSLYEELVSLRVHGQAMSGNKYDNVRIGLNARMDTIQAAILLEKLKFYDEELSVRNDVARMYTERLKDFVTTPFVPIDQTSVWAQYSIQHVDRESIRETLQQAGVPTAVFYPVPVHLSTAYSHLGYKAGDFPISEAISKRIFSLPMHPYLKEQQIDIICDHIIKCVKK